MDLFDSQQADELATLLALAEHGSFAAAGRVQQRHPSVLSKRLSALERRLGVRLVERTTRQLHLTDEGLRLADKVRQASRLLDEAQKEAAAGAVQVRGRLRLSMPAVMGRQRLSPMVAAFSLAYPEVQVEVEYSDRMVDMLGERFDAAIRISALRDSSLVATRLGEYRRILAASTAYLARRGIPDTPADLLHHNCLGYTGMAAHPSWQLLPITGRSRPRGEAVSVTVSGTMLSNDNEALLTAASLGVGIMVGGDWLLKPHLASGALVPVLPQWQVGATGGIYWVRPSGQYLSAAMRVFRQWMIERFAASS